MEKKAGKRECPGCGRIAGCRTDQCIQCGHSFLAERQQKRKRLLENAESSGKKAKGSNNVSAIRQRILKDVSGFNLHAIYQPFVYNAFTNSTQDTKPSVLTELHY